MMPGAMGSGCQYVILLAYVRNTRKVETTGYYKSGSL